MKRLFLLLSFMVLNYCLAEAKYYTYDKIDSTLHAWQGIIGEENYQLPSNPEKDYGIIYNLDTIGYSSQDELPIFAVKLSDNANVDEDEARVLILGQCHAEEIYGVEISMAIIECFVNPNTCYQNTYIKDGLENYLASSLDNVELWVVPTHNPEGLKVVHGYIDSEGREIKDPSYRKNIRDANSNHTFLENSDWKFGVGFDEDGVDLNRNYDVNWIFGEEHLAGVPSACASGKNYNDYYDYYRGNGPFSENETLAIKNLVTNNQFLLSIAYHSSRSGCVAQRVVFPWGWKEKGDSDDQRKKSPDYPVISHIGNKLHTILNFPGSGGAVPQGSRYGNAHDWIYRATGSIQFLIEVGDFDYMLDGLTEDSFLMDQDYDATIDRNLAAFFYIMMTASGGTLSVANENMDLSQITGQIMDVEGNEIPNAIVEILEMSGPILQTRKTDGYGRYNRILFPDSSYTLIISALGYVADTINIDNLKIGINTMDIQLNPQPIYGLTLNVETTPNVEDVLITYEDSFTIGILSQTNTSLPQDYYKITVSAENLSPVIISTYLNNNKTYNIQLNEANILFSDEFSDLSNWVEISEDWIISDNKLKSQSDLFYDNNIQQQMVSNIIPIEEDGEYVIEVDLRYELEWGKDFFSIMYVTGTDTVKLLSLTGDKYEYYTEYIPLFIHEGQQNGQILLIMETDHNLDYRGIEVNNLTMYRSGEYTLTNLSNKDYILPDNYTLEQNYPNPFNPSTNINFSIPHLSLVSISIFNIRGELIEELVNNIYEPGNYITRFNAAKYSSGIYFYRLQADNSVYTKKFIIIK